MTIILAKERWWSILDINGALSVRPMAMHDGWEQLDKTSPSGKAMFRCKTCDRESQTPDKWCNDGERRDLDWRWYRDWMLKPNGWGYDSPGVYVHDVTGNEFHHRDLVTLPDGRRVPQWRALAMEGRAPHPHTSHIERRRMWREVANA